MRKLSIVLLLIGVSFMAMEASNHSTHRTKVIRWKHSRRAPISIPIEAILDDRSIEVRFLENVDSPVTFQVKDKSGNIVFQDMMVTPHEEATYKIDLKDYKAGHYELLYIEEDVTFIGEFEIE